jgi:hypothetical protein
MGWSNFVKSPHVMVIAFGGVGTAEVNVAVGPVVAGEPPVVSAHAAKPMHNAAAAATRTGVTIDPT